MVKNKGVALQEATPIPKFHDDERNVDVWLSPVTNAQVDLLVPAYGNLHLTIACCNSIYNYTKTPFHLIVLNGVKVDDMGMTEMYVRRLQQQKRNITLIQYPFGWPSGNYFFNTGLKYCKTEYLATIMNSVTVEPDWELAALDMMKKESDVGIIGFKCLFPDGRIESAGIAFNGHIPIDIGRDEPGYRMNNIMEVPAVQWAFAMHRKKALVGNLDEKIWNPHVGWDDIDNTLTVKSKGWKVFYCGVGVGIHTPRASRGSNSDDAALLNKQNAELFWKRWGLKNKALEATAMDVSMVLKHETKDVLTRQIQKISVLQNLLKEAQDEIQILANAAMKELGVEPNDYLLEMKPTANIWQLKVNAQAVKPEGGFKEIEAKPAGDTQASADILEKTVATV